jgi:hypothetical protein
MNILQQQMNSYCTCTSQEYITALSVFLLHMYLPLIYYSSTWFPTAHVHPMNICCCHIFMGCTCSRKALDAVIYSWDPHVQSENTWCCNIFMGSTCADMCILSQGRWEMMDRVGTFCLQPDQQWPHPTNCFPALEQFIGIYQYDLTWLSRL